MKASGQVAWQTAPQPAVAQETTPFGGGACEMLDSAVRGGACEMLASAVGLLGYKHGTAPVGSGE